MYTTLIEPADLAAHVAEPGWAVLDCRFDLARPQWGAEAYAEGHVPQALYAHLDRELSGPVGPQTGRHPLPSSDALAATLGGWGIDSSVQVVAYDQNTGAFAARLWCLLRWLGHIRVAVLNGGYAAWQQAGLPVSTAPGRREPRRFVPDSSRLDVVTTPEVARWVTEGELMRGEKTLVDARAADRFAGQNETIDPVAGHIPGARNLPFAGNLDARGRFLPAEELRARWMRALNGRPAVQIVSMCGSGVTACHNMLALEVAGLPAGGLYAGSWSEWIRDVRRPVERGPQAEAG